MLTLYFRGHNSSPWSVPQCATLFLHPGSCICLASSVEFPWAMYSHRTQQMNTSCLNKEVCKIIVSREPSVVVRHPHILYRQDRYELSKDSKFKNSGLLGTTEFRKGGTYFIYQSIRGNIPEYLNTQQHAVRISHVHPSWVRIPPGAWIFFCCECRVLSGRGLCDELITRPEESYRLCCVVVCDLETSRIGATHIYKYIYIWH